ncbi:MAG TPA: MFS transporter [Acidimicrobiales bacterium]
MAAKGSLPSSDQGRGGGMERHWWTLIAVCGATFMLLVDITIVQVALPTLQRSLHASFSDLQWVISAYALSLSAVILTQGTLADRFGRKRVFIIGVAVFTLASLACGLAHNPSQLIAARAVQGIGGAGMFATSLALIGQDFQGAARSAAIAVWGATVGGAVAIGPLVGGALTSAFGWQWIFYVNIPIGVLTLLVSRRMVNIADPGATRLDWSGLLTFSGGLFLLVLGLTKGNDDGWSSRRIEVTLGAALFLLVLFVIVELRQERPMFDLSLFRKPAFTGVSIATFGIGAGMFALLPYLTLYLQNDLGLSPLQGGERLLPLTTLSFVVPLASRPLTERVPAGLTLFVGLATSAVGIWLFTGLTVASGWKALLPGLLVGGVGVGLANPAIAKIALGVVPPQRAGMASGISNTFRIGGVATGVAALGAVFQHRLQSTLHGLVGARQAPALARSVAAGGTQAAAKISRGNPAIVAAAHHGFVTGMNLVIMVGAVTVAVGAVFAMLVRRKDFYSRRRDGYRPPVQAGRDLVPETV